MIWGENPLFSETSICFLKNKKHIQVTRLLQLLLVFEVVLNFVLSVFPPESIALKSPPWARRPLHEVEGSTSMKAAAADGLGDKSDAGFSDQVGHKNQQKPCCKLQVASGDVNKTPFI